MKSIFEESGYNDIKTRIETLNKDSKSQWGKMNIGQMAWHCQGPFNIMLEKEDYKLKPSWLAKVFFKKSLYNDKPWKKGLPTAKVLKTKESKDFNAEILKLKPLIDESHALKEKTEWASHPAFGYFTAQQWGQMQYKHLDHHLKQFGA
ncbi:DUF1569 domain-containing protein [Winogradskyella undariae]|uniref:DUF1569 domain-containing protein n=1 Tax=Winogradskyella TaxID=286104 RepID=UPI00156AC8AC|nr:MULTISPECIES: DUF1569 domain-containing protein [Winogradskyella]NRR91644.1 DUF1569 domain-containing protein [Winogradskyella undariae]QXP77857.1 DUF1569 domain-containing protein [Winogradskyella sp. HaHa_3_26]